MKKLIKLKRLLPLMPLGFGVLLSLGYSISADAVTLQLCDGHQSMNPNQNQAFQPPKFYANGNQQICLMASSGGTILNGGTPLSETALKNYQVVVSVLGAQAGVATIGTSSGFVHTSFTDNGMKTLFLSTGQQQKTRAEHRLEQTDNGEFLVSLTAPANVLEIQNIGIQKIGEQTPSFMAEGNFGLPILQSPLDVTYQVNFPKQPSLVSSGADMIAQLPLLNSNWKDIQVKFNGQPLGKNFVTYQKVAIMKQSGPPIQYVPQRDWLYWYQSTVATSGSGNIVFKMTGLPYHCSKDQTVCSYQVTNSGGFVSDPGSIINDWAISGSPAASSTILGPGPVRGNAYKEVYSKLELNPGEGQMPVQSDKPILLHIKAFDQYGNPISVYDGFQVVREADHLSVEQSPHLFSMLSPNLQTGDDA